MGHMPISYSTVNSARYKQLKVSASYTAKDPANKPMYLKIAPQMQEQDNCHLITRYSKEGSIIAATTHPSR